MSWQDWQESRKEQQFDMRRKAGTALPQRSIRLDARYTSALARLFFLWTEHEKSRPSRKGGGCVTERKQQYHDRIPETVAQANSKVLSDRAKLTYLAVYSRRVRFNDTEPDDVTLAKEIGHNVSYIQRGLKELQEKKLIERRLYRDAATKRVKKRVLILRSLNCLQT